MYFAPQVVAQIEAPITWFDGNGAIKRRHKLHDSTPEHVYFPIWEWNYDTFLKK